PAVGSEPRAAAFPAPAAPALVAASATPAWATGRTVLTAASETVGEVAVSGLTWAQEDTSAVDGVYLRSRTGGTWSAWEAVEVETGGDDQLETSTTGTEPMAVIGADVVEVTIVATGDVAGAKLSVWNPGESPADTQAALPAEQAPARTTAAA